MNESANGSSLRIYAAEALGKIGDSLAVDPLIAIMNDPRNGPYFRIIVAEALATLLRRLNTGE